MFVAICMAWWKFNRCLISRFHVHSILFRNSPNNVNESTLHTVLLFFFSRLFLFIILCYMSTSVLPSIPKKNKQNWKQNRKELGILAEYLSGYLLDRNRKVFSDVRASACAHAFACVFCLSPPPVHVYRLTAACYPSDYPRTQWNTKKVNIKNWRHCPRRWA